MFDYGNGVIKGVALYSKKSIPGGISLDSSEIIELIKEFWFLILLLCLLLVALVVFILLLVTYIAIFIVYQVCYTVRSIFNNFFSVLIRASSNKTTRLNTLSQHEELTDSIKESEKIRKSLEETDAMLGPSPKKSFLRVYTFRKFLPHPFRFIGELLSKETQNGDVSSREG